MRPSSPSQSRLLTMTAAALGVRGREVQEPLELAAQRADVRLERVAVQEVPFGRPARRVADHPGAAAHDRDRPSTEALEAQQTEDRDEVADMQGVRRRVESVVAGDASTGRQAGRQTGCRGVQDAPPLEFREEPGGPGLAARTSQSGAFGSSGVAGRRLTVRFTPPMLSCGHSCTPASRDASATDGRSSVAPRRVARRSVESRSPSRSCSSSWLSSRPGPG